MKCTVLTAIALIAAMFLGGCSSNPVTESARTQGQALAEQQDSAITQPGNLSIHSRLAYRMLDLEKTVEEEPARALASLTADESGTITALQRGLAIAETSYLLADVATNENEARRLFARAVVVAGVTLRDHATLESLLDPSQRLLGELYNRGLARFVVLTQAVEGHPKNWSGVAGDHPVPVVIESGPGLVDPALFETLIPVDELKVDGIPNRHVRHGLGVALVAVRNNREGDHRKDRLRGPTIAEPLTLVARLRDDDGLALAFLDPRKTNTIQGRKGRALTIAADFTTPLAWLVAHSPLYTRENPSLFNPESFAHETGMYFAEPYDPNKIPIIMTHGLWSSPLTWKSPSELGTLQTAASQRCRKSLSVSMSVMRCCCRIQRTSASSRRKVFIISRAQSERSRRRVALSWILPDRASARSCAKPDSATRLTTSSSCTGSAGGGGGGGGGRGCAAAA